MHPILSERRIFGLYLVVWLIAGALLAVLFITAGGLRIGDGLILAIPMSLVYAFLCLASYYLCRAFPFHRFDVVRLLIIHSLAAGLTSSLWISIGKTWASLISQISFFSRLDDQYSNEIPLLFAVGISTFLLSVAVNYALIAFRDSREAERQALELRFRAQEAELRALRSQINPHFLFNSLNSISALTTQDAQGARTMTLLLADFLRKSLALGSQQHVPLEQELDLTLNFLSIEQVRFGPRLQVETSVQDEAKACLVPPLLLQPLAENAVVHGIAHLLEGGTISILAEKNETWLRVVITNPRDPERHARKGHGIGMENVRSRLKTLYGPEARFDVDAVPSRFRVEITLPVQVALDRVPVSEMQV